MKCTKCKTKCSAHLWITEDGVFCSPRCERLDWDARAGKWTTRFHRYGDRQVTNNGVAGLVRTK